MELEDLFVKVSEFLRDQEIVRLKREMNDIKACVKMPFFSRLMLDVHRQRLEYGETEASSFPRCYTNSLYAVSNDSWDKRLSAPVHADEEIRVAIPNDEEMECIIRVLTRLGFTVAMRDPEEVDSDEVGSDDSEGPSRAGDFYVLWDCEYKLECRDIDMMNYPHMNPFRGMGIILPIIRRESVQRIGPHTDAMIAKDQERFDESNEQ